MDDSGRTDECIHDPGVASLPTGIRNDLREDARNGRVDGEWVEGSLYAGQGPQSSGSGPRAGRKEDPHVELRERHHGDRGLIG